jgi:asparagine synthase (glutamine-hydrolysing)
MCGIAGFLGNFAPDLADALQQRLAHRGPDGSGTWHQPAAGVALVHRRLSIIDLSEAAAQPMNAVNGRYQLAFNGEIYNYKSLQADLNLRGYHYNPNSDTAVLAPLYDLLGPKMLERLEGMYAFALWDADKNDGRGELFLARDHAGIKPLYYTVTAQGLVFASELKALLAVPGLDTAPDPAALADYLTLLWSPGARTPLQGIKKLPPGHCLIARRGPGGQVGVSLHRWYQPPLPQLENGMPLYHPHRTPEQLLHLLDGVVAEQCTADVPLGAFLSGGVDSSAVVASMVATGHRPSHTYCVGFDGRGMAAEGFSDDLAYARQVAAHLGVPLTPIMADPARILARLPGLAGLLDEPTADPAPLFVEDIARQARADGLKVLMSGTGGDDIFSGYRRHQSVRLRDYAGKHGPALSRLLKTLAPLLKKHGRLAPLARRAEALAELLSLDDEKFLRAAFRTNSHAAAWQLLKPEWRQGLAKGWRNALDDAQAESAGQDILNRMLYMELAGFLPDHNLNYGDKAGMAHGVEIRVPLTDRRLMAFMADVPPSHKLHNLSPKWLFKQALKPRLPTGVLWRKKAGFGAPVRAWLTSKGQGGGRDLVESTLNAREADWLDPDYTQRWWQATLSGEVDGTYTILACCFLVWWRQNLLHR